MHGLQATHGLGGLNVEVQKITAPKPKEISIKGHEKKRKNGKPKKHKEKRQARKFMRKEAHIRRLKNYQREKKAESRSSKTAERLGIPEACNTVKKGLRRLKGKKPKEHKKQRMGTSFSGTK